MIAEKQSRVKALQNALQGKIHCEILDDDLSRGIYATDASLYQVLPLAVAVPETEEEVRLIVQKAAEFNIPILPRGSATSLAGQTTNEALILDFTTHFNQILHLDPVARTARIQPGVVRDQLNAAAKEFGLHFAPDPATSSRATIGGMIANNSSGTKSIKYGKTIDHIISLKVLLSDGTSLELGQLTEEEWQTKSDQEGREGDIYRKFRELIFTHHQAIEDAFPKVMRRVQGYPLDEFLQNGDWNLAKIFAGSEGSLGLILEATVRLEPIPRYKAAFTVHYADRMEAIREVPQMIAFDPAAIEMLDFNVFAQSRKSPLTKELHLRLIQGEPDATLTVEFFCLSLEELERRIIDFGVWLKHNSCAYAYPVLRTESQLEDAWALRKNGLGLIMGDPAGRKPLPFIEDMAIPLEHLPAYIEEILSMCHKKGVDTILYAHASVGVLHVRPALDMTSASDIELMKEISDEVFQLVKKYKGSWSGEHGDGRNRGHRLKDYFGEEVYNCLKTVKQLFDPEGLMNPGIIIDVPPMDQHLRYGPKYKDTKHNYQYKYRGDHSFEAVVHQCSGVGACRNLKGGTMCPSFRATLAEEDSTRGRANALRLGLSEQLQFGGLTDPKVLDALDLCLSCKACKSECPSNVDMAKLKSEVLQKKYDQGVITFRERMILHSSTMAAWLSGKGAPLVNYLLQNRIFKALGENLLGLDRRRTLPLYASQTLERWYNESYVTSGQSKRVVLFNDTYINYHEPHIGKEAIRLLSECGYDVILATIGCCQRPRISNGFLRDAAKEGNQLAASLAAYLKQGLAVVVCEPSCTSALTDDLPDLIEDPAMALLMKQQIKPIDVFLLEEWQSGSIRGQFTSKDASNIVLHGHCHQKAGPGTQAMKSIYQKISEVSCTEADSGCCGMAGSFGYEKEHFELSRKIAGLGLLPAIESADPEASVVANGFSCRHQISDFSTKKARHWVETVHFHPD